MKIILKNKKFNVGETKVVKKFLILPLTVDREFRWWEFAVIEYTYTHLFGWIPTRWLN